MFNLIVNIDVKILKYKMTERLVYFKNYDDDQIKVYFRKKKG